MVGVHFFKPLIPGFKSGLDIPLSIYSKYLEGRPQNKMAVLYSYISDKKWRVKLAGHRLTDGWKEFAIAHDYREGDILVFRYSGELQFHVTGMGTSGCELQYVYEADEEEIVNLTTIKDNLERSRMFLPKEFITANGVARAVGKTISLMNEVGVKWPVKLVMEVGENRERMRLTIGLRDFLKANNINTKNTIGLKAIWENEGTLVLNTIHRLLVINASEALSVYLNLLLGKVG